MDNYYLQRSYLLITTIIITISVLFIKLSSAHERSDWIPFNEGLLGGNVQAIVIDPDDLNTIYIGTLGGGFYYSENNGNTWIQHNDSLECWDILSLLIKKIKNTKIIYAGTINGIYYLEDINESWKYYHHDLQGTYINLLRDCQDTSTIAFYAGSGKYDQNNPFRGLWILEKDKPPFPVNFELFNPNVFDLIPYKGINKMQNVNKFHVGTDNGFFKFNNGLFEQKLNGTTVFSLAERPWNKVYENKFVIYAGTSNVGRYSENDGSDWWRSGDFLKGESIIALEPSFNESISIGIYAATYPSKICRKVGSDAKWDTAKCIGFPELNVNCLVPIENQFYKLFTATNLGIYQSLNYGDYWTSKNNQSLHAHRIHDLIYDKSYKKRLIAATDGTIFYGALDNSKIEWSDENKFFAYVTTLVLDSKYHYLYAGTKGKYLYRKELEEGDWVQICNDLPDPNITVCTIDDETPSTLYIGTENCGTYKIENAQGENWTIKKINIPDLDSSFITDIEIDPQKNDTIYISSLKKGVFRFFSTGKYDPWNIGKLDVYSLAVGDLSDLIFAGTKYGVYYCDKSQGFSWKPYPPLFVNEVKNVHKLEIVSTDSPFQGILYAMIYDVTDEKNKFIKIFRNIIDDFRLIESTLPSTFPKRQLGESFCVNLNNPNTIYLGTSGTGIYKYEFKTIPPQISKSTIDFGDVAVGYTKPDSFSIKNEMDFLPLIISGGSEDQINFNSIFSKSIIYPRDSSICTIMFNPKTFGSFNNISLELQYRDIFDNPDINDTYTIAMNGICRYGELDIDSSDARADTIRLEFYNTHVDSSTIKIIPWENYGNSRLINFDIDFSDHDQFSELNFPDSCDKDEKGEIIIQFQPDSKNTINDTIIIKYYYEVGQEAPVKGKTKFITLEGEGKAAILVTNPRDTIDFDGVPISNIAPRDLTIENKGNIPLIIDDIDFLRYQDNFKRGKIPNKSIDPDSIVNIRIEFTPDTTIKFYDTLVIKYHDRLLDTVLCDSIILLGFGKDTVVSPTPPYILNFENTHISHLAKTKYLEVENTCSENISIEIFKLENNTNNFEVDINKLPIILNCENIIDSIKIDFNPKSLKLDYLYEDSLKIYYVYSILDSSFISNEIFIPIKFIGSLVEGIPQVLDTVWNCIKQVHVGDSTNNSFILANKGNILLSYKITDGPSPPFFLISDTSGIIKSNSADANMAIKFKPDNINMYRDTISINFWDLVARTGIDDTISIYLFGEGADAISNFLESTFFCDSTHVGDSNFISVSLKNDGNIPMLEVEARCDHPYFEVVERDRYINKIDRSIIKNINIEFSPTYPCQDTGTLAIRYTDSFLNEIDSFKVDSCSVSGIGCASLLKFIDPETSNEIDSLEFGNIHWGDFSEKKIYLKNKGNLTLYFDAIKIPKTSFTLKPTKEVEFIYSQNSEEFVIGFIPSFIGNHDCVANFFFYDIFKEERYPDTVSLKLQGFGDGAWLIESDSNKIDFNKTLVKTVKDSSVKLTNIGNMRCKIDSFFIESDYFKVNLSDSADSLVYENADTDSILITFCPNKLESYSAICTVYYHEIDPRFLTKRKLILNLKGTGDDWIPPIFREVSHTFPILNEPDTVFAKIEDSNSGLMKDRLQIWVRRGGEHDSIALNLNESEILDFFCVEIPEELITSKGIEYFIVAYDSAGNRGRFLKQYSKFNYISPPIRIPAPGIHSQDTLHTGNEQQDYRLISIPVNIDSVNRSAKNILESSLGIEYKETFWRCADYHYFLDEQTSYYIYLKDSRFSDFEPGKPFFLLVSDDLPNRYLQSKSGYTNRTDQIFKIALHKGWNLVANPFNFAIPLKNICLSNFTKIDYFWIYKGDWYGELDYIHPWEGYAYYKNEEDTIFINPNLRNPYFKNLLKKEELDLQYKWFIILESSCQQARNNVNVAAVAEDASFEYDEFDQPEPPPVGAYIMLAFPHPEWKKACNFFTVDVQPPNNEGNFWDFSVYTNIQNSDVKLNFKNLESVPENFQILLISENLKYIQDLREKSLFIYNSTTAQSGHKFRLIVGKTDFLEENNLNIDFIPKEFKLTDNFPNPFNDATNIRYDLPESDKITIYIYNVLGELVRTLKNYEKHSPGKYFVVWDGTNFNGQPVGSGLYFCKFISNHFSKTIKMLLIR